MYKFSHCTISGATPHILPSNGAPPLQKSLLLSTGQRQRTSHSAVSMRVTYISRNRPSPWHIAASEGNTNCTPTHPLPNAKNPSPRAPRCLFAPGRQMRTAAAPIGPARRPTDANGARC